MESNKRSKIGTKCQGSRNGEPLKEQQNGKEKRRIEWGGETDRE
jgi:hypothetical protein